MKYQLRKRRWQWFATCFDALGAVLTIGRPQRAAIPKHPRKILVVRLDHIGDMVRASAIPQLLKETYPAAQLVFLTTTAGAQLLDGNPYVDEVIPFNPNWYQAGAHQITRSDLGFFPLVRLLKAIKIDMAILPRGDLRENLLARMARIPCRVGYGITGGGFLLSREVSYRKQVHEDEHTLDILKAAGVEAKVLRPKLYVTGAPQKLTEGLIAAGVVQLEAGTTAKEWSRESVIKFLEASSTALADKQLVFIGQNKEVAALLDPILLQNKHLKWRNLIGRTSIHELKQLLVNAGVFVGFDSGPAHMAASFGVTTLFLYSGTNEFEVWKPLAEMATVFQNRVDCSPCHLAKCNVPGHPCMTGIAPEKVIHWIKERL